MQLQGTAAYRGESLLFIGLYVHKAVGELHNGGGAVCAAHSCNAAAVHHPQAGQWLVRHLHLQLLHLSDRTWKLFEAEVCTVKVAVFYAELHCLILYTYCIGAVEHFTVR